MNALTIGQVAKQTQVNVETVRYYERRGLIPDPPRRDSGYRMYSPEVVKRIQFIKRAQDLGFSLKEIAELLDLRVEPQTSRGEVKQRAITKIADIERRIEGLQGMKRALRKLTATCQGEQNSGSCPILEALEQPED